MVATASKMVGLGTLAPGFHLPDVVSGREVGLGDFGEAPALLVVFMCNHCPYVKHILDKFVQVARIYEDRLGVVAINSNDAESYPEDSPERMKEVAMEKGFTFAYLFDESQEVAHAYEAACTPDFFLFDGQRRLVYRGQFDSSRPGNNEPVTGRDLRVALEALLEGKPMPQEQKPSMGCNIKWKQPAE